MSCSVTAFFIFNRYPSFNYSDSLSEMWVLAVQLPLVSSFPFAVTENMPSVFQEIKDLRLMKVTAFQQPSKYQVQLPDRLRLS